jgi:hypothetical protein
MPKYVQAQQKPTNVNPQEPTPQQSLSSSPQAGQQPGQQEPNRTLTVGSGTNQWTPTENQITDLRWIVERDLRKELGVPPQWALDAEKIEFHKRQLALLQLAKEAPRCEHVFSDGRCCKAPRVRRGKLCYAHTLMEEKRPRQMNLPPLEDANAVMLWLMDVSRGLLEGRISERTAGLMFYGLQLAMVNARFTTFTSTNHAEMVTRAPKLEVHGDRAESPILEATMEPQRAQRNTEAEDRRDRASSPTAPAGTKTKAQTPEIVTEGRDRRDGRRSEGQDSLEPENSVDTASAGAPEVNGIETQGNGTEPVGETGVTEGNPGVESAKSIFFGVEAGEGVADNRPVSPPSQPPRKSSRSEVPDGLEECAGR